MDKLFKKLFSKPSSSKSEYNIPTRHEVYEWQEYLRLIDLTKYEEILGQIYEVYADWKTSKMNTNPKFMLFDNNKSRGFALIKPSNLTIDEAKGLVSNLAGKMKSYRYIVKVSELKEISEENFTSTQYHIYLKPSVFNKTGPKANQIFGNLSISIHLKENTLEQVKFIAHTYQDQHFQSPEDMDSMMAAICTNE